MSGDRCRYCDDRHKPRWLCDPAKRFLDAVYARGQSFNMPEVEFVDPIPAQDLGLGLGERDAFVRQFVVEAATVDAMGVPQPAVIFTGQDTAGTQLPKWMYVANDDDLERMKVLVCNMVDLAIRSARKMRGR